MSTETKATKCPDGYEVVQEVPHDDGTSTLVVRETAPRRTYMLSAGLMAMAALAEMPAPPSIRSIRPRSHRPTSEKGYRPYPKLRGSLRNQPCPKCGKKQKRCIC